MLLSIGGDPSHPELGDTARDGTRVTGEGMERGEAVSDDGKEKKRVVESEDGEEGVGGGRQGGAEKEREGKRRREEQSQVTARVYGLITVEYEMACECNGEDGEDGIWETGGHVKGEDKTGSGGRDRTYFGDLRRMA